MAGTWTCPCRRGTRAGSHISKLHIEEDAGKTKNEYGQRLIDFNRCGVPLVEMVTGPDLRSADEAAQYLIRLRQLLRWLGVSEADMEKAHLRCDANVSIRPKGADYLNPKTEIKNVNSIDAVRDAINAEVERQIRETEAGRQNRGLDAGLGRGDGQAAKDALEGNRSGLPLLPRARPAAHPPGRRMARRDPGAAARAAAGAPGALYRRSTGCRNTTPTS